MLLFNHSRRQELRSPNGWLETAPVKALQKIHLDVVSGAVLFVVALVYYAGTRNLPAGQGEPGPAFFPILLALVLGGLGLSILISRNQKKHRKGPRTRIRFLETRADDCVDGNLRGGVSGARLRREHVALYFVGDGDVPEGSLAVARGCSDRLHVVHLSFVSNRTGCSTAVRSDWVAVTLDG